MRWFGRVAKVPDPLGEADPRPIDPEQLAEARAIVRRALDADRADGESAGRDLYRLGTA